MMGVSMGGYGALLFAEKYLQADQVVHPPPAITTAPFDRMSAGADTV